MQSSAYAVVRTRSTLIKRLKNWEDQVSWQAFFDTYWRLIYNFASKRGLTETEAEDVVQETMLSVAKHMPGFNYDRKLGSFKAWLFSMVRWRVTDQFRKRNSGWLSNSNSSNDADPSDANSSDAGGLDGIVDNRTLDVEGYWDAEWKKTLLEAAMVKLKRNLKPENYQIFDLCVNKEWAPARIANAYGITVDQVYVRKHRVAQAIKEEVNRLQEFIT
jgi:RNA polymerase sigma factor (sigma-70 family)